MDSYRDRILKSIEDSEIGLTTVEVAKKARVSKTTVIKYLSVLQSEGMVEFAEVGPAKLWKIKRIPESIEGLQISEVPRGDLAALPEVQIALGDGDDKTINFTFKVRLDKVCALLKRAKKCVCH